MDKKTKACICIVTGVISGATYLAGFLCGSRYGEEAGEQRGYWKGYYQKASNDIGMMINTKSNNLLKVKKES